MTTDPHLLKTLIQQGALLPKEDLLEVRRKKGNLLIGIPKETLFQENRIALIPEAVSVLVANGHEVVLEAGAGTGSRYSDKDYADAGAKVVADKTEVYQCPILVKTAPPVEADLPFLQMNQTIISPVHLSALKKELMEQLMAKIRRAVSHYKSQQEQIIGLMRIFDLDNDGMVEHAKIGGKRHSHGGTPLNVPDGSFVFSDYRGLF
jgi:hypothetical protein